MAVTKRLKECNQGDLVVMGHGHRPRLLWQVVRFGSKDVRLMAANGAARKSKSCNPNGFKKSVPRDRQADTVTVLGNTSELGQSVLDLYREDKDAYDKEQGIDNTGVPW